MLLRGTNASALPSTTLTSPPVDCPCGPKTGSNWLFPLKRREMCVKVKPVSRAGRCNAKC
jgi:hypothetical protein